MHPESISEQTRTVLAKISGVSIAKNFYLAGGTALALQFGHRESIDLDWFSSQKFSNLEIEKVISGLGQLEIAGESDGTIHGSLDNIRVSFFYYDYKQLFPFVRFENINIADERDIAAMKISAISQRASKKDFIDLYFLLEKYSLRELINLFEQKFSGIKYNKIHILKSLAYFEDAESDPMPKMIKPMDWISVKEKIRTETNKLLSA
ncbi:MAG: hypothetical protein A2Y98_00895 [Candidatus Portnoybacteria bacterium RBG_19FT_COMBO_36_7]|uniref:Nucleotidyl transferase AbiEii/AbiGii toxin family protein n=1 Tax=Candidatus Portnoybacteria bacterium RBG_19FT_COMBO_36_7 TaxID=1801992 RepID=A0A1G2F7G5_9BACT|nr:MAG: hypothetical protein A2Y98_00895 [Candidatus Portnoybacteria bacterium RBG_19FT_COMBO_36_7]